MKIDLSDQEMIDLIRALDKEDQRLTYGLGRYERDPHTSPKSRSNMRAGINRRNRVRDLRNKLGDLHNEQIADHVVVNQNR